MKREAVFEGELETENVDERLKALKEMYASESPATPNPPASTETPEEEGVEPRKPWESLELQLQSPGIAMLVCWWPGKVIRTGEATGVRYVFEGGQAVPVDIRDVDGLRSETRAVGGCCGHEKRKIQMFEYA